MSIRERTDGGFFQPLGPQERAEHEEAAARQAAARQRFTPEAISEAIFGPREVQPDDPQDLHDREEEMFNAVLAKTHTTPLPAANTFLAERERINARRATNAAAQVEYASPQEALLESDLSDEEFDEAWTRSGYAVYEAADPSPNAITEEDLAAWEAEADADGD